MIPATVNTKSGSLFPSPLVRMSVYKCIFAQEVGYHFEAKIHEEKKWIHSEIGYVTYFSLLNIANTRMLLPAEHETIKLSCVLFSNCVWNLC